MKKPNSSQLEQYASEITKFLKDNGKYEYRREDCCFALTQKEDQKKITINLEKIDAILQRQDVDSSTFLQVNFANDLKILITSTLIGFKPFDIAGLELSKIPKVVTTVDLSSIAKAIEDLYDDDEDISTRIELDILKRAYQSIMYGAEAVGFKIEDEKKWISGLMPNRQAASA